MGELYVGFDANQPEGEQLPPEVREEIARLAPVNVTAGAITEEKLGTQSVSNRALADGAVGPTKMAAGAVGDGQLASSAVTTAKLALHAVTPDKVDTGVVTAFDANGDPIDLRAVPMTSTAHAGITPDPDTLYLTWTP